MLASLIFVALMLQSPSREVVPTSVAGGEWRLREDATKCVLETEASGNPFVAKVVLGTEFLGSEFSYMALDASPKHSKTTLNVRVPSSDLDDVFDLRPSTEVGGKSHWTLPTITGSELGNAVRDGQSVLIKTGDAWMQVATVQAVEKLPLIKACELARLADKGIDTELLLQAEIQPEPVAQIMQPFNDYPALAQQRRIEGNVEIMVEVDANGSPHKCLVVGSSGHSILDKAGCKAAKRATYRPAKSATGEDIAGYYKTVLAFRSLP